VVDSTSVLLEILRGSFARSLFLLAAILGVFGLMLSVWHLGAASVADARLGYAFVAFGLLIAATPLIFWRRVLYAARYGIACTATVTEIDQQTSSRDTIDAISNGMARENWTVRDHDREFREPFENDSPWAGQLRVGSVVLVLAHPDKPKSLFAVAIQDAV
jgi:hypothetical protein